MGVALRFRTRLVLCLCVLALVPFLLWNTDVTNRHVGENSTSKPAPMVIILAYYRSGSSLTGALLDQGNDTFYSFEPLHYLYSKLLPDREEIAVLRPTHDVADHVSEFAIPAVYRIMDAILTCDLSDLYKKVALHTFNRKSKIFSAIRRCAIRSTVSASCVDDLIRVCRSKATKVVKTIRMDMDTVERFLVKYPGLKVIHLIRDPRGMLCSFSCSRLRDESSTKWCGRIAKDVQSRFVLEKKYPGRIMEMVYEDFAHYPLEMAAVMYKFLNKPMTSSVSKWVADHMLSGRKADGSMGTIRPNSTQQAYEWVKKVPRAYTASSRRICDYVLRHGRFVNLTHTSYMRGFTVPYRSLPRYDTLFIKDMYK